MEQAHRRIGQHGLSVREPIEALPSVPDPNRTRRNLIGNPGPGREFSAIVVNADGRAVCQVARGCIRRRDPQARLRVGDQTAEREVSPRDKAIRFRLKLGAGNTRVQTWFSNNSGLSLGAYYVYVRKVS